jgi:hypothetical protein
MSDTPTADSQEGHDHKPGRVVLSYASEMFVVTETDPRRDRAAQAVSRHQEHAGAGVRARHCELQAAAGLLRRRGAGANPSSPKGLAAARRRERRSRYFVG